MEEDFQAEQKVEENLRSKKMREQPIGRLLLTMSVPAILSMLVQALYNIVDSIFVAMYSDKGLEAVSIAFPMQMLIVAFAVGIGIGANARISKKLGEGKNDDATMTAKTGIFLAVVVSVCFVALGLTVAKPFIGAFTNDAEVANMGGSYLMIVMAFSFGAFVEICCSKTLQATGNMKVPMISQLIGAVINIILDPILIFGWGIFPEMGVTGAAVATVIGQIVAMCFVLTVFIIKKQDVSISPKGFKLKKENVLGICAIGFPTMVMNAIASVTTTVMNGILMKYDDAITILGIYFKLQSFVFMPVFGLTQGAMPIMSYNYGGKNKERFKHTFKLTLFVALCIMVAGLILFQFGAPLLMKMFKASGNLLIDGQYALRIISICFIPAAFGIVTTTMFQSIGMGMTSLIMSLLRQIGFILPVAAILAAFTGLSGVWFCYPMAEISCILIFFPIALKSIHKKFDVIKDKSIMRKIEI